MPPSKEIRMNILIYGGKGCIGSQFCESLTLWHFKHTVSNTRVNTLQDVITKLEPDLFLTVTGLTVKDFHLLVQLRVFNTEQMNQAVFAFRRYEDASLRYTGIESHEGLSQYGLYNTVVAIEN